MRVEWLKSDDINSKFYHSRLRWKRAQSEIVGLTIDGAWCEDPTSVKSYVKNFFESRFEAREKIRLNLDRVGFKSITGENNVNLCSNIFEAEILEVVSQCASTKCPGRDGYNSYFVKKMLASVDCCSDLMKPTMCEEVQDL